MDSSTFRLFMGLTVFLVVGSEAMNYLAFPRMGRSGYIAFPRMGRSGQNTESSKDCCSVGLKDEWVVTEDGEEERRNICQTGSKCCEGLRERVDRKADDGVYYSMCLPVCTPQTVNKNVLGKLKALLQQ